MSEQSRSKSMSSLHGKSKLHMTMEMRRRVEEDAKRLANRVALLRISELRTIKKIRNTEQQA